MDFSSFGTSLGTSFLIFVVLMLLFTWLSRKPENAMVYYPNRILKGMEPWEGGSRTRNPFAWIQEALSSSEQDVIAMSGLDTAVYFVFLNTVLGILVLSSLVLLPVLLPIAATNHAVKATNTSRSIDPSKLSMENIEQKSSWLLACLLATYWVSFVTCYFLWKAFKHVSRLRANALMSSEVRPEQFAILVRDIPTSEGQTKKEQVDSYFNTIYHDQYYKSMVITDNKKVNKIWEELEGYRKKLALAEAIYAESKSTGKPEGARLTDRTGFLGLFGKKVASTESKSSGKSEGARPNNKTGFLGFFGKKTDSTESKSSGKPEGARPTNRTGFLGLFGKKVDSIEYYSKKINELIPKLESEQKVTLREKQQGAALVFFTSRVTAASAAQSLHSQLVNNWTVISAPEPHQLIWNNLKIKFFQRKVRRYVAYIIAALMAILFDLILFSFVYGLLSLKKFRVISTLLEAFSPIALDLLLSLIRKLLLLLSKAQGIPSKSHVVRAASGKYFYFFSASAFFPVKLYLKMLENVKENSLGVLVDEEFHQEYTKVLMTFVAFQAFVSYGLELSRLFTLIPYHLKTKYWYKTEAQRKEACSPGDLDYGTRVPSNNLILTLVLCYSIEVPLLIPFGVAYFGVAWLVLRHQALNVYVPSYESYGRMWPHIHRRILDSLLLCQATTLRFLVLRQWYYPILVIPLPILTLLFRYTCSKIFYPFFHNTTLEVACHPLNEVPNMAEVFRAFTPPSLRSENIDDYQSEDDLSQVSRSVSFV